MNLFLIAFFVLVVLAGIVLLLAANKPDTFSVARSTDIKASPSSIFPLINDLRSHEAWSPFDKPDPQTRKVYSGAAQGKGAVYEWQGKQSGAGRLSIMDSSPSSEIVMQLEMLKPIKASNTVVFSLESQDDGTRISWAMYGRTPFIAKIFHVFCNMERMMGGQFESGLANLGAIVERHQPQEA